MKTIHYLLLARVGYFALLILTPLWHLYLAPPKLGISPWLVTSIWLIPLLFPLKGIIKGNPYTFAWSAFIALIYLMHAVVVLITEPTLVLLGISELLFTVMFLAGCIYFAKYRGKELGLSIRKKKEKK